MGSLGFAEILVIFGVIMLLFFAGSLPRLGRRLGKMARKPFWQAQSVQWWGRNGGVKDFQTTAPCSARTHAS